MSKFNKVCPADYSNTEQSDSDHMDDPDYIEEPTSPKISQAKGGCEKYRKCQNQKSMKSIPTSTKGGKSAAPTPTSTQLPETSAESRKRGRSSNVQSRQDCLLESKRKLEARRNSRDSSFDEIQQGLQAKRDRITPTTQAEDDDEITKQPRRYTRKSPSVIWAHVTRRENLIQCKHCKIVWNGLYGSTSNPFKHIRKSH